MLENVVNQKENFKFKPKKKKRKKNHIRKGTTVNVLHFVVLDTHQPGSLLLGTMLDKLSSAIATDHEFPLKLQTPCRRIKLFLFCLLRCKQATFKHRPILNELKKKKKKTRKKTASFTRVDRLVLSSASLIRVGFDGSCRI